MDQTQASSHSRMVSLSAGDSHTISGVAGDAVVSVQGANDFTYTASAGVTNRVLD